MKFLKFLFLAVLFTAITTSCGDDPKDPTGPTDQTNEISYIKATMSGISFEIDTLSREVMINNGTLTIAGMDDNRNYISIQISNYQQTGEHLVDATGADAKIICIVDKKVYNSSPYPSSQVAGKVTIHEATNTNVLGSFEVFFPSTDELDELDVKNGTFNIIFSTPLKN